ncbi:MAG TPA: TonB-dependent receptor [Vicinamibacterales bacterium]|nr:TonB-dependent receptor [Vicinamibacterales bacterium]
MSICFRRAVIAALFVLVSVPVVAQTGASLSGRVTRDNGDPMGGAAVVLEELKREVRTDADGAYRFDNIPPGDYHVSVRAEGYSTRRTEVTIGPQGATLDLLVELDLHFAEVVSVSPTARSQFESYQPTSVLAGQELTKQLEGTIGATLQSEPGLAMRSIGPGPARPVIRGLDGDRIVVLEDGQRVGDLSSQSADHGVTVNPASAQRIEVVRGPASLLYGANAIGGLVNVITDQIPTEKVQGTEGTFTFDLGSNAGEGAGAGDLHIGNGQFALHIGGGGRRAGEYSTPEGEVHNTSRRSSFGSVGLSWTGERSYIGGSVAIDDTKYGIPEIEDDHDEEEDEEDHDDEEEEGHAHEDVTLTPKRKAFTLRAGGRNLDGFLSSYRATFGVRRYDHTEFEGGEVGTVFNNDTEEAELMLSHRPAGRLSGTFGGWLLNRAFDAVGPEALSPPIDQRGLAFFVYEEVTWPHVTFQFGGRVDRTRFKPARILPDRDFTEFSGSLGLLVQPVPDNDDVVIALSLARAARNPALEELYFFGPHPGNFSFEIGNPDLRSERAIGFDVSLRTRTNRVQTELTFFNNSIKDFIFRNPLTEEEFEEREEEFDDRFGVVDEGENGHAHSDEFPFVEFVGADSRLYGIEAHADVTLTDVLSAEFTYDWVRGTLSASGEPLPRIPPFRFIAGLRYQRNALQVGGNVTAVAEQDRVFGAEEPTPGYALVKLFGSYSFVSGGVTNTITARVDNATNKLYRNHLNFLKDVLPEMGRNFKLVYSVSF